MACLEFWTVFSFEEIISPRIKLPNRLTTIMRNNFSAHEIRPFIPMLYAKPASRILTLRVIAQPSAVAAEVHGAITA